MNISFWVWLGSIYLIILTYLDYKKKRLVDERYNYFMAGVTAPLIFLLHRKFFYVMALIIVTALLFFFVKKKQLIGEADIQSMTWIFYGYGIINIGALVWFIGFFSVFALIYILSKRYWFKYSAPTPFYYVLLLSYIITGLLYKLY